MADDQPWPDHLSGLIPPDGMLKGQYEITGFLGEGGFGAVFKGVQHPLERRVAIKVMFPGHSAKVRERFLQEAKAAAGLVHPNVVTVFDFGLIDQRRPFIVMELVDGHDLGVELRQIGSMARERALPLFMGCLEALYEAHERGLVHRDIKPENLILAKLSRGREVLRILDFGIARMMDDDQDGPSAAFSGPRLTPTGQKVGTPHYLSPEYFESGLVTPALDVYSMGLVLAESLTGKPVVQAQNLYGYVIAHIRGKLAFPPSLLDDPIGAVIQKATARNHEDRYPDAGAFLEALEHAMADEQPVVLVPSRVVMTASKSSMPAAERHFKAHSPTQLIPTGFLSVRPEQYMAGSPPREPGRTADEARRMVTLTRGFLLQSTPVTQGEWRALMGNDPSHHLGEDDLPVEHINWFEALAYCNALSERDGLESCYRFVGIRGVPGEGFVSKRVIFGGLDVEGWRLPTEHEWEFAARAGSDESRYGQPQNIAWYDNNSRRKTRPVGKKDANAWGLYDMLGNVWEWCWDRYETEPPDGEIDPLGAVEGATRVIRGGGYNSAARLCRASNRGHSAPHRRQRNVGFRVARTI